MGYRATHPIASGYGTYQARGRRARGRRCGRPGAGRRGLARGRDHRRDSPSPSRSPSDDAPVETAVAAPVERTVSRRSARLRMTAYATLADFLSTYEVAPPAGRNTRIHAALDEASTMLDGAIGWDFNSHPVAGPRCISSTGPAPTACASTRGS